MSDDVTALAEWLANWYSGGPDLDEDKLATRLHAAMLAGRQAEAMEASQQDVEGSYSMAVRDATFFRAFRATLAAAPETEG